MSALYRIAILVALSSLFAACSAKRVLMPPRIDLQAYQSIGLVDFSSNADGNLDQFTSQRFLRSIQSSQPGVRVLELGDREEVLQRVEREEMDFDTIRSIGEAYRVDALIVGDMEVTDVKPKVDVSSALTSLSVKADVEASLTARLYETYNGATLWTDSARARNTVAHVGVNTRGPVHFGASDPEDAYGDLVDGLVQEITRDFRGYYVRQ